MYEFNRLIMILSHQTIKKLIKKRRIIINPLYEDTIRENGVDLRIGEEFAKFNKNIMYANQDQLNEIYKFEKGKDIIIDPHEHILLVTKEYIELPNDIMAFVNLRSSFARLGLFIPPTVVDAGFKGQLTIEVVGGEIPILLKSDTRFLHLIFAKLDKPTKKAYNGKYQKQTGVTGSRPDKI